MCERAYTNLQIQLQVLTALDWRSTTMDMPKYMSCPELSLFHFMMLGTEEPYLDRKRKTDNARYYIEDWVQNVP